MLGFGYWNTMLQLCKEKIDYEFKNLIVVILEYKENINYIFTHRFVLLSIKHILFYF